MQKAKGFTLVEMLLVVAILGIFAAIAVPSLSGYMNGRRAVSATEEIYSQLVYARSEAIARSTNVVVRVTPGVDGGWFVGASTSAACDPAVANAAAADACVLTVSGLPVLKRVAGTDHPDVTVTTTTNTLTFDAVRGTLTGNGTITVTAMGRELRIIVSLLGRSRICSPMGAGGYSPC